MKIAGVIALAITLCAAAPGQQSDTPRGKQSVEDAWWTGPMLAPSANTLPKGHVLIEPYVYDVIQYGAYDASGTMKPAQHANGYGSLTYIIYGLTDRFNIGVTPTIGFNTVSHGLNSSRIRFGDLTLLAQYRLIKSTADRPTISINVQETFPTAKYDRLDRATDGFGGGAYTTTLSLYSQQYVWAANGVLSGCA